MKLKRFFSFLLFAAVITAFTACDEDEDTSVPVDVTLNFTAPSDTITSFTWAEGNRLLSQTSTVGKNTSSTCSRKFLSSHFLRDFITSRSKEPSPALRAKSSGLVYAALKATTEEPLRRIDFDRFGAIDLHPEQLPYSQRDLCNGNSQ